MLVTRAPLRMSFVGGGTDLPAFYTRTPGRVISTAIDKYVYLAINKTPLIDAVSARYSIAETVKHPSELQHTRIKAALLDMGIENNIEIASFASLPSKTGMGSSSTFSVALMRGLQAYLGRPVSREEVAEAACRLEIELCNEPIGKQDQYAAAMGGFNIIQFNPDHSVEVEPVLLDYKKRIGMENRLILFYLGLRRNASDILSEQKENTVSDEERFETLKAMADSVYDFRDLLLAGEYEGLGNMLHEGWTRKKSLASKITNSAIDDVYNAGREGGAWGGKVLGAGGGGCVMFLSPVEKKGAIREAVTQAAKEHDLDEFQEIPIKFIQSGVEVLFKGDGYDHKDIHFA